jgi:hypothetical protein
MIRRPIRVWHVALSIGASYAIAETVIEEIWKIDPWLLAAMMFGGVLAL